MTVWNLRTYYPTRQGETVVTTAEKILTKMFATISSKDRKNLSAMDASEVEGIGHAIALQNRNSTVQKQYDLLVTMRRFGFFDGVGTPESHWPTEEQAAVISGIENEKEFSKEWGEMQKAFRALFPCLSLSRPRGANPDQKTKCQIHHLGWRGPQDDLFQVFVPKPTETHKELKANILKTWPHVVPGKTSGNVMIPVPIVPVFVEPHAAPNVRADEKWAQLLGDQDEEESDGHGNLERQGDGQGQGHGNGQHDGDSKDEDEDEDDDQGDDLDPQKLRRKFCCDPRKMHGVYITAWAGDATWIQAPKTDRAKVENSRRKSPWRFLPHVPQRGLQQQSSPWQARCSSRDCFAIW
mmetsp:Transcript_38028/g.82376  ORF Transcript_38028/g.82376 Transcript_38028/m.82376 type:complete len:352 (+) Transcript_38028:368-1423(+)